MSDVKPSRAAFAFIFITVALDMLALGVIVPVLPKLIERFEGGNLSRAAQIAGVFGFVWAAMQFVSSPVLGALSDRFGRRPIVLLSNFGLGLDYVLMAVAPNLTVLFIGRMISGICAASFSSAAAYIADVCPPEERASKFGMLGAAFGLGFVVGPALGGVLGDVSLRLPFWVAGGLSLLNGLYGLFILPESLPQERRVPFRWKSATALGSLQLLRSHTGLFALALAAFASYIAHESLPSVFVLYTEHRYHWSSGVVGAVLASVGVCSTLVSALLIRPAVKKLGERRALLFGLLMGATGFAIYGFAPKTAFFVLGVPFGALWGLAGPAMQSLMTRQVSATDQGKLQGALGSIKGITGMIGPLLFTQTLAHVVGEPELAPFVGAPFLLASTLLVIAFTLASWVTRTSLSTPEPTTTSS